MKVGLAFSNMNCGMLSNPPKHQGDGMSAKLESVLVAVDEVGPTRRQHWADRVLRYQVVRRGNHSRFEIGKITRKSASIGGAMEQNAFDGRGFEKDRGA